MNKTRTRLIAQGLIKPHTLTHADRLASQAKAIAARMAEMKRSINVATRRPAHV